jgi:hypothetical protein
VPVGAATSCLARALLLRASPLICLKQFLLDHTNSACAAPGLTSGSAGKWDYFMDDTANRLRGDNCRPKTQSQSVVAILRDLRDGRFPWKATRTISRFEGTARSYALRVDGRVLLDKSGTEARLVLSAMELKQWNRNQRQAPTRVWPFSMGMEMRSSNAQVALIGSWLEVGSLFIYEVCPALLYVSMSSFSFR